MAGQNSFLNNYSSNNSFLNGQSNAIQNGANSGSLISQLFAGKPAPVVAGAASVKSPNFQTLSGQNTYVPPTIAPTQNYNTVPTSTPPVHTPPATTQPIASHTTTDAGGNSTTIKYVDPTKTTATTGQLVTPPPTFGGIVGNLANQGNSQANQNTNTATTGLLNSGNANTAIGQSAADIAKSYGQQIADVTNAGAGGVANALSGGGSSVVGQGLAQIASNSASSRITGLSQAENAALAGTGQQLTAQGQTQSGLASAGGLSTTQQGQAQSALTSAGQLAQPTQLPYSSQLVSPVSGQSVGSGTGTSSSLNDAVANVTQQLQNSKIGYDDAKAQLAGYGQGGLNALSQWATDNNFNIAQSNTLAAQQGAITPNLNYANAALDNLSNAMSNLSVWGQNSNIPILGGIANWFSSASGIGKTQTSTKAGAVGEAQQAIASVLASVKGGTPTDYGSQAKALLPDDPTPADVAAAKANLTALGQQKQSIYGNPGQQTNTSTNSNTSTGTITTTYGNINPNL